MPLYPLYALLFAGTGLSDAQISLLFAIWSLVGIVAEVPTGALADRFSRRSALVASGLLQAAGYAWWITLPSFSAFAGGFVLWGLGGVLASGATEALLYDGLAAVGAREEYARVLGLVTAAGLLAQVPAAAAAAGLYAAGGYPLVGWMSVGVCCAAAALAVRLPEAPRGTGVDEDDAAPEANEHGADGHAEASGAAGSSAPGYLATLRAGVLEAAAVPAVRTAVLAVALLTSIDALEEYFSLLARDWGVPPAATPIAILGIPLAGAAGAAAAGATGRLTGRSAAALLGVAGLLLVSAGALARPAGLAVVAAFYALYRLVLVGAGARLQERISSTARATVTSAAGVGTDLACMLVYAAWAVGGLVPVAALVLLLAGALPRLLRTPTRA